MDEDDFTENTGGKQMNDQPQRGGGGDPGHKPPQHVPGDQLDIRYEIVQDLSLPCDVNYEIMTTSSLHNLI